MLCKYAARALVALISADRSTCTTSVTDKRFRGTYLNPTNSTLISGDGAYYGRERI